MTVSKEGNHVTAPCDSRNFRYVSLAAAEEVLVVYSLPHLACSLYTLVDTRWRQQAAVNEKNLKGYEMIMFIYRNETDVVEYKYKVA